MFIGVGSGDRIEAASAGSLCEGIEVLEEWCPRSDEVVGTVLVRPVVVVVFAVGQVRLTREAGPQANIPKRRRIDYVCAVCEGDGGPAGSR